MPDDPRPEPVAMTDDEIAKLAPLRGEESFSVRFAVTVDLEPNCKGPVPFLGPHFCELTRKQFRDLYGKSLLCRTDRIENIDAGCGPLPELPKKAQKKATLLRRTFRRRPLKRQRFNEKDSRQMRLLDQSSIHDFESSQLNLKLLRFVFLRVLFFPASSA